MSQCRQQLLRANQCGNTNICCNAEDRYPSKEELLAGIEAHLKHNYGVKKILQNAKANPRFSSNENRIKQYQCYNMESRNSLHKMTDCVNGRVMNSATQIGSSLYDLRKTRNSQCVYESADLESCVDLRTAHQNTLSLKKASPKTRAQAFNKYSQWLKCQSKPSSDNKNLKIEIEPQKNLSTIKIKIDPQKKGKSKSRSGSVSRKTSQETYKGIKAKKSSTTASPRPHQATKKKLLDKTASSAMKYAKLSEEIMRYTKQLKGSENPSKQCYHLPSSEIQTRDSDFLEMQNDINSMTNKARVKHRISIHNHDTYIVLNGKKSSTIVESKKIESNDRSSVKRNSSGCINLSKTQIVDTRKPSIVIDDSTYVVPQNSEENQYLILPYLANAKENLEGDQTPANPEMSEKQRAQQRDSKVLKSMPKRDSQIENPEVMNSTGTSNPMESTWESHINQKIQYTRKDEPSNTTPLKEPKLNDPCTSSAVEKNSRTSASQPLRENTYVLMTEKFMESHKDAPKDTDLVTEKKRKEDYVPIATERKSNNVDQILVLRGSLNVKPNQDQQEEITLDLESLSLDLDFTNRSSELSSTRIDILKNKYSEQKKYYEQQLKNFRNENTQTSSFQSCRNSGLVPISEGSQSRSDSDPKQSKDPKPNNVGYSSSSYQSRTPRVQVVASHNETLKQYPRSVVCPLKYASHEKRPSSMTQQLSASNTPRGRGKSLQNLPPRLSMTQKPPTSNTPRGSAKSNEYLTPRRMEPETRISMETNHPKVELNNKRIDTPRRVCDATQTSDKCGKKGELGATSEVKKSRSETVPKQSQSPKPNNGCYSSSCFKSRTPRAQVVASHNEALKQSPRTSNIIPKKYGSEDSSQKNTLKRSSTTTQKPSTSNTPRGSVKTSQNLMTQRPSTSYTPRGSAKTSQNLMTQRPSTSNTPRGSAKSNKSPRRMEPKRKNSIETKHPKVELHKTWNDTLRCSCASPKTRISIQNKSTDNKYQNEKSKSGKYSESDAISKESNSRSNSVGYSSSSRQTRSPRVPNATSCSHIPIPSPRTPNTVPKKYASADHSSTSCSHIPIPSPRTPNTVPKKYASEDHSSSQKNNVKRSSSTMAQKVPTAKCSAKSSDYITPKPTEPKRRFSIETKHPTIELELANTCNDNRFGDTSLISISIHNEDNENCEKALHLKCFPECTVDDGKTKINTKENTFILKSKIKTSVPISSSPSEHIETERPTHSEYSMTSKTDETEMNSSPKEVAPKLRYSESRSRQTTTTDQKRFNPEHIKQETFIHGRSSHDVYGTPEKTNETVDEIEMISTSKEVPPRYSESRSRSSTTTNQRIFDAKHHEENSFIHRRSDTEMISIPKEALPKLRYSESRSRSSTTTDQKRFNPEHIKQETLIHGRSSNDKYATPQKTNETIDETEMISTPKEVSPKFRNSESRSRSSTTTNQKRFDPKHSKENSFILETQIISSPKEVSPKFRYSESKCRSSTTTNQKRFDPKHIEDNTFIIETEMISTPKEVPPKSRYSESRSRSSTTTNQKRFDPKHIEENSFIHEPEMISCPKEVSPKFRYSESRSRSSTTTNQKRFDPKHIEDNTFIIETEMISTPKEVPPKSRYSESRSRSSTTTNQKRVDPQYIEENSLIHDPEMISSPKEVSPKFRYSESRSRSSTTTNQKRFDPKHIEDNTFIIETEMISTPKEVPPKSRYSELRYDPKHCIHGRSSHRTEMISSTPKAFSPKLRYSESRSRSSTTANQERLDAKHHEENSFNHRRSSSTATEMISVPKEVSPKLRYSESRSRSSTTARLDPKHIEESSFIHYTEMISTPKEVSPKFRYSELRSRSTTTTNQKRFNPEQIKQERSSDDEYAIPEKTNENMDETEMFSTPIEAKLRIVNFIRSKSTTTTTQTNSDLEPDRETRISTSYESLESTTKKTITKDCNCPRRVQNNAPTYEADSLNTGDKELLPSYSQPRISKSSSEYSTSLQNELNLQGKNIRHTLSKSFEMIPNSKKSKDNDKNTIPAETLKETLSRVVGADNSDSDVNSRRLSAALEEASKLTSEVLNELGQRVENINRNNDVDSGRRLSAAYQRASQITEEIKQEVDKLNNDDDVRRISTALHRASVVKANADDTIRKEVEILTGEIQAVFTQLDVDEEKPTVSSKPEVQSKRHSSIISPNPYMPKIHPINLDASSGSQSEGQTPGHPIAGVPREIAELIYNLQNRVKTCDAKIQKQTEIIEQLKGESATCPKPLKEGSRDILCTCCTCDDQEDQVENVSDSSDEIPPFTGCECMREDYYAIMRIAYDKR